MVFILYTIKIVLDSALIEHYNKGENSARIEHYKGGTNMAMTATQQITISSKERVCINCGHYARCYREVDVPGETWKKLVQVSFGWCTLREERRGPLYKPCKDYETKEEPC